MRARALAISAETPLGPAGAVRAARRGEPAGWDWLFDRYHRLVLRYVMARLGDPDGAEDVAQEVFVAAIGAIRGLREDSERAIEGWLLGIARNKVADRRRLLARERRHRHHSPGVEADAAEVAVVNLSVAEVREALEQLSDKQREVIVRRFVLDQSLEDVAGAMRRPVGAVKSLQHRGLAALARLREGDRT